MLISDIAWYRSNATGQPLINCNPIMCIIFTERLRSGSQFDWHCFFSFVARLLMFIITVHNLCVCVGIPAIHYIIPEHFWIIHLVQFLSHCLVHTLHASNVFRKKNFIIFLRNITKFHKQTKNSRFYSTWVNSNVPGIIQSVGSDVLAYVTYCLHCDSFLVALIATNKH